MTQTPESSFQQERQERISRFASDQTIQNLSNEWVFQSMKREYLYNFDWLGRPIIQYPQDIVAIQELVWRIRPSLIVETGIAHGGSLALSAALLALLDYSDSVVEGKFLDTSKSEREVMILISESTIAACLMSIPFGTSCSLLRVLPQALKF